MKKKPIWIDTIKPKIENPLTHDITCNILIIGGGIAGITTALNLKDQKNVVLIDKGQVGEGVTKNTTGKLTHIQGNINIDIYNTRGLDTAISYLNSQQEAIKEALNIINKYNITCDLEKNNSYLFTENNKQDLKTYKKLLTKAGIPYQNEKIPLNIPQKESTKVENTYVFNPLKFINQIKTIIIKNGVKVYENTKATKLTKKEDYYQITTKKGTITAKKVIICTHYPFFIIPGLLPVKLSLTNSYALSAKAKHQSYNAINLDKNIYSIRYYQDNIIIAGLSHPLYNNLDHNQKQNDLINFYQNHFSQKPDRVWETHDLTAHDYLPIIGKLNSKHPNLLIATAFGKWGMTNGILAGKILADIINNKPNEYEKLFHPNRTITLQETKNFITNNFAIAYTLIKNKITKNKPFYTNTYIKTINGISCGIYIDENNQKHIVKNTCPHLKCSLIFNKAEKTWDCPCHGSRFDIDGNLVEGPSVYSIKLK